MLVNAWKRVLTAHTAALVALLVSVLVATGWWLATGSDRRVDAACGTWLEHRPNLRYVVEEYDEAAGRATGSGADVHDELDDLDRVTGVLDGWAAASPDVRRSLDGSTQDSGETSEHSLHFFLGLVDEQLNFLDEAAASGDPVGVAAELGETSARLQTVDDICLSAARQ